jgi:hypothetical protein
MTTTIEKRPGEALKWTVNAAVDQWAPEQVAALYAELGREPSAGELAEVFAPTRVERAGNMLLTAGLTLVMSRLTSNTLQAVDPTHTRIGVGNSNAAEAVGQTDLQAAAGSANRWFMTMDAAYPSVAAGVLTARATFAAADANFSWAEWGIDVTSGAAAAGATVGTTLLNRKVAALGTKVNGAVWQLTVTITLA